MKRLTAAQVNAQKVAELGLDPSALDFSSVEAIAGALRRAAGFLCPCTASSLVRSVVRPLRGLVEDLEQVKSLAEDTLEAIIALGDLLEYQQLADDDESVGGIVLYAAPPSFVARASGAVVLLGVAPDHLSALPDELQVRIEYEGYIRRISPRAGEDLHAELLELGLVALPTDAWLKAPANDGAHQLLNRMNSLLESAPPSRDIPGLHILDPERPVRYYRGRWTEPKAHSGRFVARRQQAYGADLWCYAELCKGQPVRLVDFPLTAGRWRGCDNAWYLQLAIDAVRGFPQQFRLRPGPTGSTVLELFSPVPMWARRRWDALAAPVPSSGCLFAYRFRASELGEELTFARNSLWTEEVSPITNRQ